MGLLLFKPSFLLHGGSHEDGILQMFKLRILHIPSSPSYPYVRRLQPVLSQKMRRQRKKGVLKICQEKGKPRLLTFGSEVCSVASSI